MDNIEIKCTVEQKSKLEELLKGFKEKIEWKVIEYGSITDEEIKSYGIHSETEIKYVKEQYAKYPKGFFKNPICALH